jgi:hypothetical protein
VVSLSWNCKIILWCHGPVSPWEKFSSLKKSSFIQWCLLVWRFISDQSYLKPLYATDCIVLPITDCLHKQETVKYYATHTRLHKVNKNAFKENLYSNKMAEFSASSLFHKSTRFKRAFFCGWRNWWCLIMELLPIYAKIKLPNKGNPNSHCIMMMKSNFSKTTTEGRGIFPDKEIILTTKTESKKRPWAWIGFLKDIKSHN